MLRKILNRKVACYQCRKEFSKNKCIKFANYYFCSEKCITQSFIDMSTDELLKLNNIDMQNTTK